MASTSSLDRIAALRAELKQLEQTALAELVEQRKLLVSQLADLDKQITDFSGKPVETKTRTRRVDGAPKSLPLQELKQLLADAPDKTLNIRKANLDLRNIKILAESNPGLLRLAGKGAWPIVTLLK